MLAGGAACVTGAVPPSLAMPDAGNKENLGSWTAPSLDELEGSVPGFDFVSLIACGGMAAVYEGWQRSLDRRVALKILPPALHDSAAFTALFESEARALGRLSHPGVVSVIDFGRTTRGWYFIAMEFVDGVPLHHWVAGRSFPEKKRAMVALLRAVAACHEAGIVHADLKPNNVFVLADGSVKVMDFGLASRRDAAPTADAPRFGTPPYTAPESYAADATPDPRSDVFSLGKILLEVFGGPAALTLPTDEALDELDPRLAALVRPMLSAALSTRESSAAACAQRLDALELKPSASAGGSTAPGRPPLRPTAGPVARRRAPRQNTAALAVLVAVGIGAVLYFRGGHGSADPPSADPSAPSAASPIVGNVESLPDLRLAQGQPKPPPADEPRPSADEPLFDLSGIPGARMPANTPPTAPQPPAPLESATPLVEPPPVAAPEDPVEAELRAKLVAAVERRLKDATVPAERAAWTRELERLAASRDVPDTTPPGTPDALAKLWEIYRSELAKRRAPVAATAATETSAAAGGKVRLTFLWGCDDWATLFVNGAKIEASVDTDGGSQIQNIYRAEAEVAEGDVVAFSLKNVGRERWFGAVSMVDTRVIFAVDSRWELHDGEASPDWLRGGAAKWNSPRRVAQRDVSQSWLKRFSARTGLTPGGIFMCWGEDPAACHVRRVINSFDINAAAGRK